MSVEPYNTSWIFYGDPGSLKSTLAATFPKPMLVLCFDQPGKDRPYWRRGKHTDVELHGNIPTRLVHHPKTGKTIIRIEYFRNANPRSPNALNIFRKRFQQIESVIDKYRIKTVVLDSLSGLELAARHDAEFKLMKGAKDPRKFYASAKEALEELVYVRATGLVDAGVQVVTIAHVNTNVRVVKKGDETIVEHTSHYPAAPGQLASRLPGGFAEVYRCYVRMEQNEQVPYIQSEGNTKYAATTQIPAPNNMAFPTYASIWKDASA